VQQRGVVTMADLESERLALLGAIAELLGVGWDQVERAWSRAIALFSDIVYAAGLDLLAGSGSSSTELQSSAGGQ
jgi:hypothetical protein